MKNHRSSLIVRPEWEYLRSVIFIHLTYGHTDVLESQWTEIVVLQTTLEMGVQIIGILIQVKFDEDVILGYFCTRYSRNYLAKFLRKMIQKRGEEVPRKTCFHGRGYDFIRTSLYFVRSGIIQTWLVREGKYYQ